MVGYSLLGTGDYGIGNREQGIGDRDQADRSSMFHFLR
jgi:hypothetical protein